MSIKKKIMQGAIWNSISQFGSQAINFILTIILARLLTPDDFGLLGQVAVMTGFLGFISEFGITGSLIQKKDADEIDCDTAYFCMFFFSITIYIIVYFLAPTISSFYNNESLTLITRVFFIQFLINPFSAINEILEIKNLNFNKIAYAELGALSLSGIIGIAMAYNGFGVWSLVWQQLLRLFIKVIILVLLTEWKPHFKFSLKHSFYFIKNGMHFTYRNMTLYFSENIDFLLIGKIAGARMLGIYNLAFRMSNYPFSKLLAIFGQMIFPAFNTISDDIDKVRSNYLKLSFFGGVILIPLLLVIFFGIPHIVGLLIGEKWIETVPIVKILVVYLVFSSVSFSDDIILITFKKIKLVNAIKTITAILLLISGYFATTEYGAMGMATVFTVYSTTYFIVIKTLLFRTLGLTLFSYVKQMKDVFIITVLLIFIFYFYNFFMEIFNPPSLVYLIGEGLIFIGLLGTYLIKKRILDIKNRKINLDNL